MTAVRIIKGFHAHRALDNVVLTLAAHGLRPSQKGPFLLVDGSGHEGFPQRRFRVHVADDSAYEVGELPHAQAVVEAVVPQFVAAVEESDDEIKQRIGERFSILTEMTMDLSRGKIRGLVVTGAPGVGKSYESIAALHKENLYDEMSFNGEGAFRPRYTVVKGFITASALYRILYEHSDRGQVIVFDDTDGVLYDDTALNLLKAALDTTRRRMISWINSDNRDTALPNSFEFRGGVLFISNINFQRTIDEGRSRLIPHLEAIMSRCYYLDMTINTLREKLLRIDQVSMDLGMLTREGLEPEQCTEVIQFVHAHARNFRELSLRKVVQLAELRKIGGSWQRKAELTLLKHASRAPVAQP